MTVSEAWFLPADSDALGLLRAQASVVDEVVGVLAQWARDELDVQIAADRIRGLLMGERAYRQVLSTAARSGAGVPLDPEDLFDLGERYDDLAVAAYAVVREAQLSGTGPDGGLAGILAAVTGGTSALLEAVAALPAPQAAELAEQAIDDLAATDRAYRAAIAGLQDEYDPFRELLRRELYRRAEQVAACAARVAQRARHAVAKAR